VVDQRGVRPDEGEERRVGAGDGDRREQVGANVADADAGTAAAGRVRADDGRPGKLRQGVRRGEGSRGRAGGEVSGRGKACADLPAQPGTGPAAGTALPAAGDDAGEGERAGGAYVRVL